MNAARRGDAVLMEADDGTRGPLRIELAPSSDRVREQLRESIVRAGSDRVREANGDERPDLVIVDGDDIGAGAAMRLARRRGGLPVVVMSVGQLPASFIEDAVHVLPKPVTTDALVEAVDAVRAQVAAGLGSITLEVALRDDAVDAEARSRVGDPTPIAPRPRLVPVLRSTPTISRETPIADAMDDARATESPRASATGGGRDAAHVPEREARVYASAARDLARSSPDAADDSDAARRRRLRDHVLCGGALAVGDPGELDALLDQDQPYRPERYIGAIVSDALSAFQADPADESGRAALAMTITVERFTVQVLPDVDRVYTNASLGRLSTVRELFQPRATGAYAIRRCSPDEVAGLQSELLTRARGGYSIEAFLWLAALMSSRGRLPEHCDIGVPVRLRRWPNLTRLELLPGCLQLARGWHREARSICDMRDGIDVPARCVHAFYNAATALGLTEPAPEAGS